MSEQRRDDERERLGEGAALGASGLAGFFAWRNRRAVGSAIDGVSPGTWRGALNVAAWFAGWLVLSVIGSVWLPLPAAVAIGLVVMLLVGRWWDGRQEAQRPPI